MTIYARKRDRVNVRVMVFNTTFNNISAISWRSVLLVEETGVPVENHWHAASHWQTLSHKVVSSTIPRSGIRTQSISGDRPNCICMHVINSTTIRPRSRQPLQYFFLFFLTKIIRSKKKLTTWHVIIVGTPSEQFFNYFKERTSYIVMRWWWGPLCTRC